MLWGLKLHCKGLEVYLITFLSVMQFAVKLRYLSANTETPSELWLHRCLVWRRHHCDSDVIRTMHCLLWHLHCVAASSNISAFICGKKKKSLHPVHPRSAVMFFTSDVVTSCCDISAVRLDTYHFSLWQSRNHSSSVLFREAHVLFILDCLLLIFMVRNPTAVTKKTHRAVMLPGFLLSDLLSNIF